MKWGTTGACLIAAAVAAAASFPSQGALAQDRVTFVTDFGFNGRHAYYFVALEKGYYEREGLQVEIVRGQGSADSVRQVGAGTADIGFADAAAVILARANDGIAVKLASVIYQRPPHAIYVLAESGIAGPEDLVGRTIADTAFSANPRMFPAYARAAGIDPASVNWVVANSDALPGMLALGRADGIGQFTVGEPLLRKSAAPKEIVRLAYADAGLDYYSNGIIATDATLANNPDLVRRFITATLDGLRDAIADPAEAAAILHRHHRHIELDIGEAEMEMVAELATLPDAGPGSIDMERMARTIEIVEGAFDLSSPVTPEDVVASDFVTR